MALALPFDPDEVVTVEAIGHRHLVVQLIMKNGELRTFRGDAVTDDVREWVQRWKRPGSGPREHRATSPAPKLSIARETSKAQ